MRETWLEVRGRRKICTDHSKIKFENSIFFTQEMCSPAQLAPRGLGQGPVRAPSHLGLDAGSLQRVDEPHVVVQARFIDVFGSSVREDASPRDGKAIVGHTQVLQGDHILGNLVITVTGHVSGVIIPNPQWCVRKGVPNTEPFAICSPRTFDLKMTRHGLSKSCSQALPSQWVSPDISQHHLLCHPPISELLQLPVHTF